MFCLVPFVLQVVRYMYAFLVLYMYMYMYSYIIRTCTSCAHGMHSCTCTCTMYMYMYMYGRTHFKNGVKLFVYFFNSFLCPNLTHTVYQYLLLFVQPFSKSYFKEIFSRIKIVK